MEKAMRILIWVSMILGFSLFFFVKGIAILITLFYELVSVMCGIATLKTLDANKKKTFLGVLCIPFCGIASGILYLMWKPITTEEEMKKVLSNSNN